MSRAARLMTVTGVMLVVMIAGVSFRQASPSARTQQPASAAASRPTASFDSAIDQNAQRMLEEGRKIFRYDTFGSEAFWGDQLGLHQAIVGEKLGGVGPGVSPKMAWSLGLKVHSAALPADVVAQIKAGKVNMDDPASTVLLLRANAVVGVTRLLPRRKIPHARRRRESLRQSLQAETECGTEAGSERVSEIAVTRPRL